MDLFKAMGISASALEAQRTVMYSVSMNLANIHTTGGQSGEPYRRRRAILSPEATELPFQDLLSTRILSAGFLRVTHADHFQRADLIAGGDSQKVRAVKAEVIEDSAGYQVVYDPSHPDADASGYVALPNINLVEEMINLLNAVRSYEANVTAFNAAKGMVLKALEIGR